MNTKTEKQIADIKSQTIGVEIEMNNITRMNAAKLAAEYFGTHRYADTHRINGSEGTRRFISTPKRYAAP